MDTANSHSPVDKLRHAPRLFDAARPLILFAAAVALLSPMTASNARAGYLLQGIVEPGENVHVQPECAITLLNDGGNESCQEFVGVDKKSMHDEVP